MAIKPRKPYKRWTVADQTTAEVAAACGVTLREIGSVLNAGPMQVLLRVKPEQKIKQTATNRTWQERNKEKNKEKSRQWKRNNRERCVAANAAWAANNPEKVKALWLRRRARKAGAIKASKESVSGASVQKLIDSFNQSCAYCGSQGKISIDHVIPISKGGIHSIENLVPACLSCNCSKGASAVEEWYKTQPFFCDSRWDRIRLHRSTASQEKP